MEGPASRPSSMLYLWQQPTPFNRTDSCKFRIATLARISLKISPKLKLQVKFFRLVSKKRLTNLQVCSIIMVFRDKIPKRCPNLHQMERKTHLRETPMSMMKALNSNSSSSDRKTTTILGPSRSQRKVKASTSRRS